jgi:hypothetical protein
MLAQPLELVFRVQPERLTNFADRDQHTITLDDRRGQRVAIEVDVLVYGLKELGRS